MDFYRTRKISARVHRGAGSQAARDFARLLDAKEKSARSSHGIEIRRRKITFRANEVGGQSAAMQTPEFKVKTQPLTPSLHLPSESV